MVWMLGKNTILKAIHNADASYNVDIMVWMLGKNTILKAIHNKQLERNILEEGVNAG